ncbi:MAG: helix-turn-helix domain-containing protein, partial [Mariniphaga sp.]
MNGKSQKIFFAGNIKFLRERKKMSQEALASTLGLTRAKLAAIEAGNTKSPQPDDYLKFSEFFKISIDTLLKIDLSKLGELKVRELEAGNDVYIRGGNLRVLAISVDRSNNENVEYVPVKAKAGYMAGYN